MHLLTNEVAAVMKANDSSVAFFPHRLSISTAWQLQ
jgi:hypothetical protein